MIELKPNPNVRTQCPECGTSSVTFEGFVVPGLHTLLDFKCNGCRLEFYSVVPVGHTVGFDLKYGKTTGKLYDNQNAWVSIGLVQYFSPVRTDLLNIERKVYKNVSRIVLINALDFLYGHCLLKLFNTQYHLDEDDLGVVVLVPSIFEWLIPEGCAEVWLVDAPLATLRFRNGSIDDFVSKELRRFDTVFLSNVYSHPDFTRIDIKRFTRVSPFDISSFAIQKKRITFVLREDRWWLSSLFSFRLFQFLRKLGLKDAANDFLFLMQQALVVKTIALIRDAFDEEVEVFVVGTGNRREGFFNGTANDLRCDKVSTRIEQQWCDIYSKSHLVIGVHGSNMLLPSALAAGCIEILPEERYANIVQDMAVRYSDRRQLFLYRLIPQFSKPRLLAQHVLSVLRDYSFFNKNMCVNQYRKEIMINDED